MEKDGTWAWIEVGGGRRVVVVLRANSGGGTANKGGGTNSAVAAEILGSGGSGLSSGCRHRCGFRIGSGGVGHGVQEKGNGWSISFLPRLMMARFMVVVVTGNLRFQFWSESQVRWLRYRESQKHSRGPWNPR